VRPVSLYVDLDDVLAQTADGIIELARQLFGRVVGFDDLLSFDLGESFSLTSSEHAELLRAAHEPEFVLGLRPQPGALECLTEQHAAGHSIEIVTGRPPDTLDDAREWLLQQGFPPLTVRSVDKYGRHAGEPGSLPLAWLREQSFDFAVEDSFDTAAFLARETGSRVLLLDRPWNARPLASEDSQKIARVRDWYAVSRQLSVWP